MLAGTGLPVDQTHALVEVVDGALDLDDPLVVFVQDDGSEGVLQQDRPQLGQRLSVPHRDDRIDEPAGISLVSELDPAPVLGLHQLGQLVLRRFPCGPKTVCHPILKDAFEA